MKGSTQLRRITYSTVACAAIVAWTSAVRSEETAFALPDAKGSLVIIGGGARTDHKEIWDEVIRLAGGPGKRIAVFPTASGYPIKSGNRAVSMFNSKGADAFLVPIAPTGIEVDCAAAVRDPQIVESVENADGVFFIGGAQGRIRDALLTADGQPTPVLEAVWNVYRRGGVVAGTSAGAAIMSRVMIREAGVVLTTMLHGMKMGKEIDRGLGFLDPSWFVDQHCMVRGRFARSLVAMHSQNVPYGVGIDEDSALIVQGEEAQVVGYRGAIVMDLSDATSDAALGMFNLRNAKLTYLDHGDKVNLRTRSITPSPAKTVDRKIDPSSANFRPYSSRRLFFNDILANSTIIDVMKRVIDHSDGHAIGLAFDGAVANEGPTTGFEFRFYRDRDSCGWETEASGVTSMTVQNIHLDIRPIQFNGPLYTEFKPIEPAAVAKGGQ